MKTSISSIAKELNLSKSTVSRALLGHPRISRETCERVQSFAKKYGYVHNRLADGFFRERSGLIGIIVPDLSNPFFAKVISGIQDALQEKDYQVILCQSMESQVKEKESILTLMSYRVEGIIMACSSETEHLRGTALESQSIPLILFDRVTNEQHIHKVIIDDYQGTYDLARQVKEEGYTRIIAIAGPMMTNQDIRLSGLKDACTDLKLPFKVLKTELHEEALDATCSQIGKPRKGTVVIGLMDRVTLYLVSHFERTGDTAVAGFMDDRYFPGSDNMLKVIQPAYEIGLVCARQITDLIKKRDVSYTELLKPEIRKG